MITTNRYAKSTMAVSQNAMDNRLSVELTDNNGNRINAVGLTMTNDYISARSIKGNLVIRSTRSAVTAIYLYATQGAMLKSDLTNDVADATQSNQYARADYGK
jgi:hypothetical protein